MSTLHTRRRRQDDVGENKVSSTTMPSEKNHHRSSSYHSSSSSRRRSNCLITLLIIIAILGTVVQSGCAVSIGSESMEDELNDGNWTLNPSLSGEGRQMKREEEEGNSLRREAATIHTPSVAILLAALGLYLKSQQGGGLNGWMGVGKGTEIQKEIVVEVEETQVNQEYLRKLIKSVNDQPNLGWKAKFNKFGVKNKSYGFKYTRNETEVRKYMEHLKKYFNSDKMKQHISELDGLSDSILPSQFDSRLKWPHCPSISNVPNQGGCGSCYAVASIGVASDRACIASNGTFKSLLSPMDVIGCCSVCGNCFGGDPLKALTYWVEEGIVTGGRDGCRPYEFDLSCGVPCSPATFKKSETERTCKKKCQSIYYQNDYDSDKHFASIAYSLYPRSMTMDAAGTIREQVPTIIGHFNSTSPSPFNLTQIRTILKKELYVSGPFTMAFPVTEEFLHYSTGVFTPHPIDDFISRVVYWHVVKVIGWGEDSNGDHYWLCVNSFGSNWGDNGVFKINTDTMEKFGLEYETALV